jgi:hypothetical protein
MIKRNNINFDLSFAYIVPKIEVKSDGQTMVICSPSIHKNGKQYKIIGKKEPAVLNEDQSKDFETALNKIFDKHSRKYRHLSTIKSQVDERNHYLISQDLRKIIKTLTIDEYSIQNCKIYEGSRHITLLSFANRCSFII